MCKIYEREIYFPRGGGGEGVRFSFFKNETELILEERDLFQNNHSPPPHIYIYTGTSLITTQKKEQKKAFFRV